MAYASVASLVQTIELVNYHDDPSVSSGFKDQITSLHEHTSFLQSFLEDDAKRAENWEETIRDVADRAEEIIDLLVSDSLRKSELGRGVDELERVIKDMKSTADRVKGRNTKAKAEPDRELMLIVELLREDSYDLKTIPITGPGGIGKSSLARDAYNHLHIVQHFSIRACSTVAQEYSGRDIVLDLLRSLDVESDDEPFESLFKILYGKRYLIALYDVWSVQSWQDVRRALPDNRNGSRIILTTRIPSAVTDEYYLHQMGLLGEDDAWNLLQEKIFKGEPCPSQLEHHGKIISMCCSGIRLTIELVSGILAADQTEAAWKDVSESIKIASEEDDFGLPQVLSLCYTYLPHHLRPFFLYLGCFREGHEIHVSKLIKLWVAEGFLNQSESKSFQETGDEHVEDLVRRSLVSVSKRKSNGRIKSITVHGIVRELCLRQSQMGSFFHFPGGFGRFELESCRRVSSSNCTNDFLEGVYDSTMRTVISYSINSSEACFKWSIGNASLLRILDLSNAYDYDLPEQIFELFHLRYLAFHSGFSISEAISHLQNLQTLIIYSRKNSRKLVKLPKGLWRMPQLRHLLSFSFNLPIPTLEQREADKFSALENLETLSRVVDFVCSRENLQMILNVKKLSVFYTNSFKDTAQDIELHNLINLPKLETLKIEMEWPSSMESHKMGFAFPPTLRKLSLCGVQLPWEDLETVASLPNLQVLKLRNHACTGETWETSGGGFSRLEYLMIEESDLEEWIMESSHFPRLKSLVLHSCLHMSEVPCEIGEIPTLRLIELDQKDNFLLYSIDEIQEKRESLGYDLLQIHVVA